MAKQSIERPVVTLSITVYFYLELEFMNFPLNPGVTAIGQYSPCHLILDSPAISEVHAIIEVISSTMVIIMDLNSESGTSVNNHLLQPNVPYIIQAGDVIWFGPVKAALITIESFTEAPANSTSEE